MAAGKDTRTVELVQAFMWTCDDCGRDNFERAITMSPESIDSAVMESVAPDEAADASEWLEEGGEGEWLCAPTRVRCQYCNAEFEAETA